MRLVRTLLNVRCRAFGRAARPGQKRVLVPGRFGARQLMGVASTDGAISIDLEHCPNCGGELKIIAAILEQPVIAKILTHLGPQARAPPRAPARGSQLHAA
jgi:hypothetical protein